MAKLGSMAIVRQPLVETVMEHLRHMVSSQEWKVGEKIPTESELAEMFQVGRNTIREAVRVLSHSGMLEVRQGNGTFVRNGIDPSAVMQQVYKSSLSDHLELRCMIESQAARCAAQRRTTRDLKKIESALLLRNGVDDNYSIDRFIEKDILFHKSIVSASHNEAMCALYEYFSISVMEKNRSIISDSALLSPDFTEHHDVYLAIKNSDPDAAEAAVKKLLEPLISQIKSLTERG